MAYEFFCRIADTIGLVGVILILIAYYFLNTNKMTPKDMNYQWLNFFGAWLILFSLFFHWNTACVIIEVAWILISVLGLYQAKKARKR